MRGEWIEVAVYALYVVVKVIASAINEPSAIFADVEAPPATAKNRTATLARTRPHMPALLL